MSRSRANKKRAKRQLTLKPLAGMIRRGLLLSAGVLIAQPALVGDAQASPQGGAVVAGQGSIAQPDANNTLIHQQSNRLAIDWQSFDLDTADFVQFNQPSASAIALNRVLSGSASQIFGSIKANGRIFIVNGRGVYIGKNAKVDVGSLFVSGLDISTADFMQGNYQFSAAAGEAGGVVVNHGLLQAASGGSVSLVGGSVSNEGVIVADLGHVIMAAGRTALVDFDGDGLLRFEVDGEVLRNLQGLEAAVSNSGEVHAQGGQVLIDARVAQDIFSRAINSQGLIKAARIQDQGGVVRLVGLGGDVSHTGSIDVSADAAGGDAGSVSIVSDSVIEQYGAITADAASGNGGLVEIESSDTTILGGDSVTSARAELAGQGGTVHVLGDQVGLFDNAMVDVSGANGGGTALIGGDYQGGNPEIRNASLTFVSANAQVRADALDNGDGGQVIAWSDVATYVHGDISARGGELGGDGGFVEISGKRNLTYDGNVDLGAVAGNSGTVLFDPTDILIHGGTSDGDDVGTGSSDLNPDTIDFATAPSAPADGDGAEPFDIFESELQGNGDTILRATNTITVTGVFGSGNIAMGNNDNLTLETSTGEINLGTTAIVGAGDGFISIDAGTNVTVGALTTNDGTITVDANGGAGIITLSGDIRSDGGSSDITLSGDIRLTQSITIDPRIAASSDVGGVTMLTGTVSATAMNVDLTLDSSGGSRDGGDVSIEAFSNDGGEFIRNLIVDTTGGGDDNDGNLTLNGDITVSGTLNFDTDASGNNTVGQTLLASDVVLTADAFTFDDNLSGVGKTLTVQPLAVADTIGIAGGTCGAACDIALDVSKFLNGFAQIIIGRADGTGVVDVEAVAFNDPVTLRSGAAAGSITVDGQLDVDGAAILNAGTVTTAAVIDTMGNDVTFITNSLSLGANVQSTGATSATAGFQGLTGGTTIGLGTPGGGTLNLTETTLAFVQNTFSNIAVGTPGTGATGQTAAITIDDSGGDGTFTLGNTGLIIHAEGDDGGGNAGSLAVNSTLALTGAGEALTVNGTGSSTTLSADIVTAGPVTINDAVLVDSGRTIDTTNGDTVAASTVTIDGTIDGNNTNGGDILTIDAAQAGGSAAVNLKGDVGAGAKDLEGLIIDGAQIDLADVIVEGSIAITGSNIDLNGTTYTAIDSGGTETIEFTGSVDLDNAGPGTVTVTGAGGELGDSVTFSGLVGSNKVGLGLTIAAGAGKVDLVNVVIDGAISVSGGDIDLNGTAYTSNDSITFVDAVDLEVGPISVTSGGGTDDDISFATIDGGQAINLNAGALGDVSVGIVGGTTPVSQFDVAAADLVVLQAVTTGAGGIDIGASSAIGTSITLNGALSTDGLPEGSTAGNLRLNGPTILASTLEFDTNDADAAGGSQTGTDGTVTFLGSVTSQTTNQDGLVLDVGDSAVNLSGVSLNNLDFIAVRAAGDVTLGATTVADGSANPINANVGIDINNSGQVILAGNLSTDALGATNGDAGGVSISGGTDIQLNANVTIDTEVSDVGAGIDAAINIAKALDGNSGNRTLTLTAGAGAVTTSGKIGNDIGQDPNIGAVTITGGVVNINELINADGAIAITGNVSVATNASGVLDARTNDVTFITNSLTLGANVQSTGGSSATAGFQGLTGGTTIGLGNPGGGTLNLTEATLAFVQNTFSNIAVGTPGTGAAGQTAAITIDDSGGDGTFTLGNTGLIIHAEGDDGGGNAGSLAVNSTLALTGAGEALVVNGTGSSTTLSANIVTAGPVTINDAVLVDGARTIDTTNANLAAASTVTIDGTIDGTGGTDTLKIDAAKDAVDVTDAAVSITGNVGSGAQALEGLTIDGAQIDLADVIVAGSIDIEGTNIVLNGTTYTALDNGGTETIGFTGPVDLASSDAVIITGATGADDTITFTANLTDSSNSTIDIVSAASSIILQGTSYAADALTFSGAVDLLGAASTTVNVDSSGGGVTFTSTVQDTDDQTNILSVTATGGSVDFQGTIGDGVGNHLSSLDATSNNDVTVRNVSTAGDISLSESGGGSVILAGGTLLSGAGGAAGKIDLNNSVRVDVDTTLDSSGGAGNIELDGGTVTDGNPDVELALRAGGGSISLGVINFSMGNDSGITFTSGLSLTINDDITQTKAFDLSNLGDKITIAASGKTITVVDTDTADTDIITTVQNINAATAGSQTLSFEADGAISLGGQIGDSKALGGLTVIGAKSVTFGDVDGTPEVVVVDGNISITADEIDFLGGDGTLDFGDRLTGGRSLTLRPETITNISINEPVANDIIGDTELQISERDVRAWQGTDVDNDATDDLGIDVGSDNSFGNDATFENDNIVVFGGVGNTSIFVDTAGVLDGTGLGVSDPWRLDAGAGGSIFRPGSVSTYDNGFIFDEIGTLNALPDTITLDVIKTSGGIQFTDVIIAAHDDPASAGVTGILFQTQDGSDIVITGRISSAVDAGLVSRAYGLNLDAGAGNVSIAGEVGSVSTFAGTDVAEMGFINVITASNVTFDSSVTAASLTIPATATAATVTLGSAAPITVTTTGKTSTSDTSVNNNALADVTITAADLTLGNNVSFDPTTAATVGSVTLDADVNASGSTLSFLGNNVSLLGDGSTFDTTNFDNSGNVTIGNAGADTISFNQALNTTVTGGLNAFVGPSGTTIAGIVDAGANNSQIDLSATTITADSQLISGSAALNVASVTDGAGSFKLSVQDGSAGGAASFLGAVTVNELETFASNYAVNLNGGGTVTADTNFLNTGALQLGDGVGGDVLVFTGGLDTTGGPSALTVGGAVATTNNDMDLNAVTLLSGSALNSGSGALNVASVTDGVNSFNLALQSGASSGTATFSGGVTVNSLTTFNGGYGVVFNGGGTVDSATTFNNTGGVTFGDTGDTTTFTAGVTHNAGNSTIFGTLAATNNTIDLANVTLTGASTINSGGGGIDLATVSPGGFNLDVNGGATGVVAITSFDEGTPAASVLDIVNSSKTAIGSITADTFNVTNTATDVIVSGALNLNTLSTSTNAFNLELNGGGDIANAATLDNTGDLRLGNATGDVLNTAGLTTSVGGTLTTAGTITSTGNMDLGAVGGITLGANTRLDAGTNTITLDAATGSAFGTIGLELTANAITLNGTVLDVHPFIVQPGTAGETIGVAGGGGTLQITQTNHIDKVQSSGSFRTFVIGREDGTGSHNLNSVDFNSDIDVVLRGGTYSGGTITVDMAPSTFLILESSVVASNSFTVTGGSTTFLGGGTVTGSTQTTPSGITADITAPTIALGTAVAAHGNSTLTVDTLTLGNGPNSVRSRLGSTLTIQPGTAKNGMDAEIGGSGGDAGLLTQANVDAISSFGFDGTLNLGMDPTIPGGTITNIFGNVTITADLNAGISQGETAVVALGDITFVGSSITDKTVTLIAMGDDGTLATDPLGLNLGAPVENNGGDITDSDITTPVVIADTAVFVGNDAVGESQVNPLNVDVATLIDIAAGADKSFVDNDGAGTQVNLGASSSLILSAFQDAGGFAVGSFETEIISIGLQSTGLEVRDESLFTTDVSAFGSDFLIFDPGEGAKVPYSQDENIPPWEDAPIDDLEDDDAWAEFYDTALLEFVMGRWLSDPNLITYVLETYGVDLSPEAGATLADIKALHDRVADKAEPSDEDAELLRLLAAVISEYPLVVADFQGRRDTAIIAERAEFESEFEQLEPEGLELPEGDDVPELELELEAPSAMLTPPAVGLEGFRVVGQAWSEGGIGIEAGWWHRMRSAWPDDVGGDGSHGSV